MQVCCLIKRHASNFDRLDEDLVVEILVKLPVKSVHGCKCVSKRWLNLISTRYFISCYRTRTTPSFGLYYQKCRPWQFEETIPATVSVSYTTKNNEEILKNARGFFLEFLPIPIRVLASNNGLVLCSDAVVFQKKYYVCNPLSKSWVEIPPPLSAGLKWARIGFLCKEDRRCFVIVRIANHEGEMHKPCVKSAEIYSSETGRWAETDLDDGWKGFGRLMFWSYGGPGKPFRCNGLSAVVCKGLLHWSGFRCVFVFDPNNNNNRFVKLPAKPVQFPRRRQSWHNQSRYLGESKLGNHLMFISFASHTFTVWELKHYDNNGEWRLLHDICLDQMVFRQPRVRSNLEQAITRMSFLAFDPFNKHVVFLFLRHQVLSFNMCKRTIKTVGCVAPSPYYSDASSMPFLIVLP